MKVNEPVGESALVIGVDGAELETCRSVLESLGYRVLTRRSSKKLNRLGPTTRLCLISAESLGSGQGSIPARLQGGVVVLASAEQLEKLGEGLGQEGWEIVRTPLVRAELRLRLEGLLKRLSAEARAAGHRRRLEELDSTLWSLAGSFRFPPSGLELPQLASRLLDEIARNTGAEGGSLFVREAGGLKRLYSLDPGHAPDFLPFPLSKDSVFQRVMDSKRLLRVADINSEPALHGSGWVGYRDPSFLVVPMYDCRGDICALFSLHSIRPPFTTAEPELGTIVASLVSQAIHAHSRSVELERGEARYRSLFENTGTALVVFDEQLVVQRVNQEWQKLAGYRAEEVVGRSRVIDFVAGADRETFTRKARERRVEDGGVASVLNFALVDRQGGSRNIVASLGWLPETRETIASLLDITALEEFRRTLREETDFVKSLIEISPTLFIGFDPQRCILMVNRVLLEVMKYAREELVGKDFLNLIHPGDREKVCETIARLLGSRRATRFESRLLTSRGEELLLEGQGKGVWDEQGRIRFLFIVGNDVSLHRKALQALQESERTFRTIVENTYSNLVILSDDLRIVYANPLFRDLIGKPTEDLAGLDLTAVLQGIIDDNTIEFLRQRARERIEGKSPPPSYCFQALWRGKETRSFQMRACMITTAEGRKRVVAQFMDVTETLRAKRELQDSEALYRSLVESAPVGIISVERGGRVIDVNPKFLQILGSPLAAATRAINMLTLPQFVESGIAENFHRCFETGKSGVFESPYRNQWGKERYLRYQVTPLRKDNGRIVQLQAIFEDITEQKSLEAATIHARKMEALGTLTGGIAHQYNNLLQIIQGYAELLCLKPDNVAVGAQEIRQAAGRAAGLTKQLLTFSKVRDREPSRLCLNEEIRTTVRLLQISTLRNMEVELHLAEELLPIFADAAQIQQMLTNLAANAYDALGGRGRIRIETANSRIDRSTVSARCTMEPGPCVVLLFSDDGPGIDPADLDSIFDPFFTRKTVGKGVGLGLSVVYGIVKGHGGHIECRSAPGKGTTFEICLPADRRRIEGNHSTERPQQLLQSSIAGSQTILVVDDEPTICKLAGGYLSGRGYKVISAAGSHEALQLFRGKKEEIDLVVLDLVMPGVGGEKCLEEMLRLKPEQKVLAMSGYSVNTTAADLFAAGACGFIRKPFRLRELLKAVRAALGS